MVSQEYRDYLNSDKWRERRLAKLEQVKFKCERCGERDGLEVHHKTYERLGNERNDDLQVLCRSCHWAADEARRGNNKIQSAYSTPIEKSARQFNREKKLREQASRLHRKKKKMVKRTIKSKWITM